MAKPKQAVLVNVTTNPVEPIAAWVNNSHDEAIQDILTVEGVTNCRASIGGPIRIMIDQRYDTQEVADEIRGLLSAEVPDVFKDIKK